MNATTNQSLFRSTSPARIWPLAGLLVVIVTAFVFLEGRRSEQLVEQTLHFEESLGGVIMGVEVNAPQVTQKHWDRILQTPALRRVTLKGTDAVDEGLAPLASLPGLQTVYLEKCSSLSVDHLAVLAELPGLTRLRLSDCPITDEAVPTLIKMKSLRWIEIHQTGVSLAGFECLRRARPDLTIRIRPEDLVPDTMVPHYVSYGVSFGVGAEGDGVLRLLDMPHDWTTGETTESFEGQITHLSLWSAAGPVLPRLVPRLTALQSLSISDICVSAGYISWPKSLNSVVFRNLDPHSDLSTFAAATSLEQVTFNGGRSRPVGGYQFLTELPNLTHLRLFEVIVEPAVIEEILGIASLQNLELGAHTVLTDDLVRPILKGRAELPILQSLALYHCELSPEIEAQLKADPPAATLNLNGESIQRTTQTMLSENDE